MTAIQCVILFALAFRAGWTAGTRRQRLDWERAVREARIEFRMGEVRRDRGRYVP